jgi:hypothetical protein
MTPGEWQKRRGAWHHDWLRNQFLLLLSAYVKIADGRGRDAAREQSVEYSIFADWCCHVEEASLLIESFEVSMSPRTLLDQPPFSAAPAGVKLWLAIVSHELWIARGGIEQRIRRARIALEAARGAFAVLEGHWRRDRRTAEASEALASVLDDLREFRNCCEALGADFSYLSRRVDVV